MRALWFFLAVLGALLAALVWNHDGGTILGLESDDFARLVTGGVIVAMLASGAVVASRGGFGRALRDAVIWVGIAFVLVAGYAFRDDLAPIFGRTAGALVPGLATDGAEPGSVVVQRARDGHFLLRGKLNGEPATMIFDTGASVLTLTDEAARRAGIDTARLSYSVPVSTANGRTTAAPVRLDTVEIGSIRLERVDALVARPGQLFATLLGMNVLDRLSGFAVEGDRLVLKR